MYLRTVERTKGGRTYRYVYLCSSYRDENGKPRQRRLATLGNLNNLSPKKIESLLSGFRRIFHLPEPTPLDLDLQETNPSAYNFGAAWAVRKIIDELGWPEVIENASRKGRWKFDLLGNVRVLLTNRLLDPSSKLHILEWFKGTCVPGVKREEITYVHLLRAMDFLRRHKDELERGFAERLVSLFDLEVDLVFYDVTSSYFEVDKEDEGEDGLRRYGFSRDHRPDRPQVVVGLVMTRGGIPLAHRVFSGSTADTSTLSETVEDLKDRFGIKRCVFVADRGMLSEDNLEVLRNAGLDYIVSHQNRRGREVREVIRSARFEKSHRDESRKNEDQAVEVRSGNRRFVVAYNEEIARETRKRRERALREADQYIRKRVEKLNRQDAGERLRGRPATDEGTLLHLHDHLRDRGLLRFIEVYLDKDDLVSWRAKRKERRYENEIDGKLVVETSCEDMAPAEIASRYKELADIERAFRTMKSSLDLRPMFHRVKRRIEAHVFLCVMALQLDRLIRGRLHAAGIHRLPTRALEALDRVRLVSADLGGKRRTAVTTPDAEQLRLFGAIGVGRPKAQEAESMRL